MVKNKIAQRAVAAGLTGLMAFGAAAPAALATGIDVKDFSFYNKNSNDDGDYFKRIGGDTRYDTMKKIVEAYTDYTKASTKATILDGYGTKDYWTYHSTVVLASGDNFPDALAANGLAGYLTNEKLSVGKGENTDAVPVVLTKQGSLSSQAKDLLKQMQVQNVIIMGGTAAVSQDVEDAINKMGIGTQRVAGKDRQETSLKALQRINGNWEGRKGTYDLIIATGDNYADALSISPYAYRMGTPVILTKKDGTLTDEQVKAIKANDKIAEIVIVGGTAAVSDAVMGQIGTVRNNSYGIHYTRIAGVDRYETSAKIAEFEVAAWTDYYNQAWSTRTLFNTYRDYPGSIWQFLGYGPKFSFDHAVVATGENFPDALVGGQLAGGVGFYRIGGVVQGSVDGFDAGVWSPCPLLLTKDGDTRAENVIASRISKDLVAVDDDYYFTNASWNQFVRNNYASGDAAYTELINKWYTYGVNWYATKKDAYDAYPFYVNLDELVNGISKNPAKVTKNAEFKYTVDKQGGSVIFTLDSKSDEIESVDFGTAGQITVTYTKAVADKYLSGNQTQVYNDTQMDSLVDDNWDKVTGIQNTVNIKLGEDEVIDTTIDNSAVIRYVGETENFYGIILGGTSAVSNNKRDDLDRAVADHVYTNSRINDTILWGSKIFGVNLEYTRLVYRDSDSVYDYFTVVGTSNVVRYNRTTSVWDVL